MPKCLVRFIRLSFIGLGVSLMLMAGFGLWALHAVFDASFEHQLGWGASEIRPLFYVMGSAGILLVVVSSLVRIPRKWLAVEAPPQKEKRR